MAWDFKNASSNMSDGFEPIEEGRYNLEVEDAQITKASTGTTMLNVTMTVTSDPYKNRKVWKSFSLDKPKAMRYVIEFFKATENGIWKKDGVENADLIESVKKSKTVSAWLTPATTNNGNPTTNATKFLDLKTASTATTAAGSDLFS